MNNQRERTFLLFDVATGERSWRGLWILLGVYLGAIVFSAIVSPWVYWLVQVWANATPNELNTYLARKSFDDYFDRLRWVPVLLSLPWIMRVCGLLSWERLGVSLDKRSLFAWIRWFLLGCFVVGIAAWIQCVFTQVDAKSGLTWLSGLGIIFKALAGGLILGFLEETVFRGLIFRLFYTALTPLWAVILSSAFFAYTHFKMPGAVWDATDQVVSWKSGFFVGFWTLLGITQNFELLAFVNLWALGVLLCLIFMRFRSLLPCMGFHAGIVALLLSYKKLFVIHDDPLRWLLGSGKMIDGSVPLVLLSGLILFMVFSQKKGA